MNNLEFHLAEPIKHERLYYATLTLQTIGPKYESPKRIIQQTFVYIPTKIKRARKIQKFVWEKLEELQQNYMATAKGLKAAPLSVLIASLKTKTIGEAIEDIESYSRGESAYLDMEIERAERLTEAIYRMSRPNLLRKKDE